MLGLKQTLHQIRSLLTEMAPEYGASFNQGISDSNFNSISKKIHGFLPLELKSLYQEINGCIEPDSLFVTVPSFHFWSFQETVEFYIEGCLDPLIGRIFFNKNEVFPFIVDDGDGSIPLWQKHIQ